MIELRQLNKTYHLVQQTLPVLRNIDLTIQSGEIFGVLGKSGAGKSTLLRCINLLEKPDNGQVIVDGIDLTTLSMPALREQRRKIGIIFQHFNLLESRTVYQNVALPLEILRKSAKEIEHKVLVLLDLVGIADKKQYWPSQLSGGQKQRVAIARALATDPSVLLSDEATSALDTQATQAVLNLMKKINRELGVTIMLITHELAVVKQICDRVAVLDHGQLIEQGSTIDVLIKPQNSITQELVQQISPQTIEESIKLMDKGMLLKLTFIGEDSDKPLISNIIKNFQVTVNILQAQIEKIQDTIVGFTVCELAGRKSEIMQALQYIRTTSIQVEVLNHE